VKQGRLVASAFTLLCLLATGCARLEKATGLGLPSASPRPSTAIVLSVSSDSVYLVDPVTGVRHVLAAGLADFQAGYAAWAPDHRRLAYGNGGIVILDAVSSVRHTFVGGQSVSMPAWSPNGKQIVYGDGSAMWVSPATRPRPERVRVPQATAPLEMAWRPGPAIAFEGLKLDCTHAAGCYSTDLSEIWTVQPDGTGLKKLTQVGHAEKPKWSSGGSQILFVRRFGGKGVARSTELWEVNADGTGTRQVLKIFDVVAADWSPDGSRLAIVRPGDDPDTLQLWIAGADGSGLHSVGEQLPGTDATLDW
jgi:Tol biopolymer transport system component